MTPTSCDRNVYAALTMPLIVRQFHGYTKSINTPQRDSYGDRLLINATKQRHKYATLKLRTVTSYKEKNVNKTYTGNSITSDLTIE